MLFERSNFPELIQVMLWKQSNHHPRCQTHSIGAARSQYHYQTGSNTSEKQFHNVQHAACSWHSSVGMGMIRARSHWVVMFTFT